MKSKFLITLLLFFAFSFAKSQINPDVASEYFNQVHNVAQYYRDVIITNADNEPYPAVGVYHIEKSFFYTYNKYHGTSLLMIVEDYNISAVSYSTYYIYDDFQNLVYFIYQASDMGELIIKFNGSNSEILESTDSSVLAENYFIDTELEFSPENILRKAKNNLKYCKTLWDLPDYEEQTLYIRERFKEINNYTFLKQVNNENITAFYWNDELVKVIFKEDSNKEFYFDNNQLIFAYYPETSADKDIRAYFGPSGAFKVIYGKDNLKKTEDEFHNLKAKVLVDFEIIENLLLLN